MEFSPLVIVGLFFVALIAGLVDAIAGGGGLLTVPALLATGMPTPMVFGTNKGSAVFGSGAALLRFWRARLIDSKRARLLFPLGMLGSFGGAALLLAIDPKVLRPMVLVLLVVAGFIVAFVRPPATHQGVPSTSAGLKTAILALVIGAYDGFFGPGTGTFLIIGFVVLLHLSLQQASANAKVVNFASNLAAMLILTWKGLVIWKLSIPMAVGQFIGGTIGAQLAVKGVTRSCVAWCSSWSWRSSRSSVTNWSTPREGADHGEDHDYLLRRLRVPPPGHPCGGRAEGRVGARR